METFVYFFYFSIEQSQQVQRMWIKKKKHRLDEF